MEDSLNLDKKGGQTCWTENLAVFQIPFHTSLQALPDPQESNISGPWVWGVRKSYTGGRGPSQHCGCAVITCMCSNGRQGGMDNLSIINLTISQSLTQAQQKILLLYKQLKALLVHTKTKTTATKRKSLRKKLRMLNRSATSELMGEPTDWTITAQPVISPRHDTK